MGVEATLCVVCGAPVNHDHYRDKDHPVSFSPEHDWLKQALAISLDGSQQTPGTVDDQQLTGDDGSQHFVGNGHGSGESYAMHQACWEVAAKPSTLSDYLHCADSPGWAEISDFHEQLFNFLSCTKPENNWLLQDPRSEGAKNKSRIEAMLKHSASYLEKKAAQKAANANSIEALIEKDNWGESKQANQRIWFRKGIEDCERAPYSTAMLIEKPYLANEDGLPKDFMVSLLDGFKADLQKHVEWKANAILALYSYSQGKANYLVYTLDDGECEKRIRSLGELDSPEPSKVVTEKDADWDHFFTSPHL